MFDFIFTFLVDFFSGENSSYVAVDEAYKSAWRKRKRSGDDSEDLLHDELSEYAMYKNQAEHPAILFEYWRESFPPRVTRRLLRQ